MQKAVVMLGISLFIFGSIDCAHEEEVGCVSERDVAQGSLGPQVNSPSDDFAPAMDGKTLYFASSRRGVSKELIGEGNKYGEDEWKIEQTDGGWTGLTNLSINAVLNEGCISITRDGKKVYFGLSYRDEQGKTGGVFTAQSGGCDLYEADWPGFVNMHKLPSPVNSPYWDSQPSISPDGNTLYFASNRPGGRGSGTSDIYMTTKDAQGRWSQPVNLSEPISTPSNEYSPCLSSDGRTLYFASDGHGEHGGLDIYRTVRHNDGTWETPECLPQPFNSAKDDCFPFIDARSGKIYLASNRDGGCGGLDLYAFPLTTKAPVVERETYFELGRYNVPFFVTGYYRPNTSENLRQLIEWLPTKFKGLPIEDPKDKYDQYVPVIESIFDTVRTTCVDTIFPQFRQVARANEYLEMEVDGYVDPRPIQGKYVEEDISFKGINIKKGDRIDNPVLSRLRAYYTMVYLRKLFESSDDYKELVSERKIEFVPVGKNIDVSSGPFEAQRRISIVIRRQTR
jgi:hypothetical protein